MNTSSSPTPAPPVPPGSRSPRASATRTGRPPSNTIRRSPARSPRVRHRRERARDSPDRTCTTNTSDHPGDLHVTHMSATQKPSSEPPGQPGGRKSRRGAPLQEPGHPVQQPGTGHRRVRPGQRPGDEARLPAHHPRPPGGHLRDRHPDRQLDDRGVRHVPLPAAGPAGRRRHQGLRRLGRHVRRDHHRRRGGPRRRHPGQGPVRPVPQHPRAAEHVAGRRRRQDQGRPQAPRTGADRRQAGGRPGRAVGSTARIHAHAGQQRRGRAQPRRPARRRQHAQDLQRRPAGRAGPAAGRAGGAGDRETRRRRAEHRPDRA